METQQIVIILCFIVFAVLLFKAFKYVISLAGICFLLIAFAFLLRNQGIISFNIPEDLSFENVDFKINEKYKLNTEQNENENVIHKKKLTIDEIKEQEKNEEKNIKKVEQ